jgi:hypothetical protein
MDMRLPGNGSQASTPSVRKPLESRTVMRQFGGEVGDHALLIVGIEADRDSRRRPRPGFGAVGGHDQSCRQAPTVRQIQQRGIGADGQRLRTRRAEQGQVALAFDRFPQFALDQRGLENPGQFGNAAAIGGEIQPAARVAVNFHGAHGFHARRIQMAPGA